MQLKSYFGLWVMMSLLFLFPRKPFAQYDEKYRPQFHFSPRSGWIGDPDGLVYSEGKYHLFWWGHAVSEDLVHWKELPYPMQGGDGSFSYFSGSVVVDKENTSGFGTNSMIAVYTMHKRGDSLPETQGLSVSNDQVNFHFYKSNPVLDVKKIFFRDPQIFWYAPTNKWIMVVTVPDQHRIHFYSSGNLKDWIYLSEFGDLGARSAFWECPDLFELDVDGKAGQKKWVLMIGQGPNRVQYFMGSFNGKKFIPDEATISYLNEGKGMQGTVFEDFNDAQYTGWKIAGTAFGTGPNRSDTIVRLGEGNASSSRESDRARGTLTSAPFIINKNAINFLVAGGDHPGRTCINLVVSNSIVRTATGGNSSIMKWEGWDVSEFIGQKATIQIVDNYGGEDWGHIDIDHIVFSNIAQQQKLQHALWLDYGTDFYATRSWRDIDNKGIAPVFLGWLGNWQYARNVPSQWGKGFESVPREIALKTFPEGVRLIQAPVDALKKLRGNSVEFSNRLIKGNVDLLEFKPLKNTYEIEAIFNTNLQAAFGVNLLVGDGRKLVIKYDPKSSSLCIDRSNCTDFISNPDFTEKFATKMFAPVEQENNRVKLRILVDQSSVEVFTNDGKIVLSVLTYPSESQTGIQLFSEKGQAELLNFKAWELSSIWKAGL
ncbi:glycoside hydrolase family 32 protein [Terrimonas alba]|uniref:glycoside hydrolase family 32 protein n=1 Tax=Terrimonas alba TaxID=3349636 RepID=UPI0035F4E2D7